jgi:serine/threonine-protein kinase RsbW
MSHPFREIEEIFSARIPSLLDRREALIFEALGKLKEAGVRPDPFFDRLILDEAITNAIIHGNAQDPAKTVTLRLFASEGRWGAEVIDEGEGFDWRAALEKADGPPPLVASSGRGILLMRKAGAELHFLEGGRRIVIMRKR